MKSQSINFNLGCFPILFSKNRTYIAVELIKNSEKINQIGFRTFPIHPKVCSLLMLSNKIVQSDTFVKIHRKAWGFVCKQETMF